jgi:hypothetical protein
MSIVVPSGQIHEQKKRPKGIAKRSTRRAGQYFRINVFAAIMAPIAESGLIRRYILAGKSLSVRGSKKRRR